MEELPQNRFEIPLSPRDTTKEIEAQRAVLRKRVTGEVGLCEQAKTCDSSGTGELMPLRYTYGPELHLLDDAVE